jgi:hypothetical protein
MPPLAKLRRIAEPAVSTRLQFLIGAAVAAENIIGPGTGIGQVGFNDLPDSRAGAL